MTKITNTYIEIPTVDDHADIVTPSSGEATLYFFDDGAGNISLTSKKSDNSHTEIGSGGGGSTITIGAFADTRPASPSDGDIFISTDGLLQEVSFDGDWITYEDGKKLSRPPIASSWTTYNLSPATLTDSFGTLLLNVPTFGGDYLRVATQDRAAGSHTATMLISITAPLQNDWFSGIALYDSISGGFVTFGVTYSSNPSLSLNFRVMAWDDVNTYNDDAEVMIQPTFDVNHIWLRAHDDGDDLIFSYSNDGIDFITIADIADNLFYSVPDEVGFYVNANIGSSTNILFRVLSFEDVAS